MEGEHRKYLQETVVPVVAEGMEKLMYDIVKERKRVLEGVDWENGYLPDDWKKIETVKWLGEYLLSTRKKEQGEQQAFSPPKV
ncbi:hypothetical protein HOP50_19g83200 [Chloropicon primus]|uniref:Uncharacterized protein n=1 Tax=Chloropicon primus TaxID=1764295 RepID=A0A5B8MYB4_9CHLO|nr:hypothetical protein A3770_19p82960 [Chloropicon primus]UPR04973.1 hypothetical protein HOP50_19g83200 [Chloropicon primus]|eukprot:QDZ25778.1 hypothetical protein A3770_19p82960 [Chloropicon primus]